MLQISFPDWVKRTPCERVTRSRFVEGRHGMVRLFVHELTPHGYEVKFWRDCDALAPGDGVTFFHRTRRREPRSTA